MPDSATPRASGHGINHLRGRTSSGPRSRARLRSAVSEHGEEPAQRGGAPPAGMALEEHGERRRIPEPAEHGLAQGAFEALRVEHGGEVEQRARGGGDRDAGEQSPRRRCDAVDRAVPPYPEEPPPFSAAVSAAASAATSDFAPPLPRPPRRPRRRRLRPSESSSSSEPDPEPEGGESKAPEPSGSPTIDAEAAERPTWSIRTSFLSPIARTPPPTEIT